VRLHEAVRLYEHSARATGRVVDAAAERLQHVDQKLDDAARREELTTELAFGVGELTQHVLEDATENIQTVVFFCRQILVGEQIDEAAEGRRRQLTAGVILGQNALERRVLFLDGFHGVVNATADVGLLCRVAQVTPPVAFGDPEDPVTRVFVTVFEQCRACGVGRCEELGAFVARERVELEPLLLEHIGDVLEKDQTENHVLVLGGVHARTELVGRLPERVFKTRCCGLCCLTCHRMLPHAPGQRRRSLTLARPLLQRIE
jgi:hypothetical protein